MQKRRRKKHYQKPKIIYRKQIEVLAGICDTAWGGAGVGTCRFDACDEPFN